MVARTRFASRTRSPHPPSSGSASSATAVGSRARCIGTFVPATLDFLWNGQRASGRLRDGEYEAVVEAESGVGTISYAVPFVSDTVAPVVRILPGKGLKVQVSEPSIADLRHRRQLVAARGEEGRHGPRPMAGPGTASPRGRLGCGRQRERARRPCAAPGIAGRCIADVLPGSLGPRPLASTAAAAGPSTRAALTVAEQDSRFGESCSCKKTPVESPRGDPGSALREGRDRVDPSPPRSVPPRRRGDGARAGIAASSLAAP